MTSMVFVGRVGEFIEAFDGDIADVRVYSRALAAVEIGAKMFTPLEPAQEAALEAYYKFSDGNQAANTLGNPSGQFN
eukprot:220070-Prorocentrum_minimum.AAC.1